MHVSEFVQSRYSDSVLLTLWHSKIPKCQRVLAILSAVGLKAAQRRAHGTVKWENCIINLPTFRNFT